LPDGGVGRPLHLAPRLKKEESHTFNSLLCLHGQFQGKVYLQCTLPTEAKLQAITKKYMKENGIQRALRKTTDK
jgi:hypothetical protein